MGRQKKDWNIDDGDFKEIKATLDRSIEKYSHLRRRDEDPVGIVWNYESDLDREIVGLFASSLAYGRVDLLRPATIKAMASLGPSPSVFLLDASTQQLQELWPDFVYRMTKGDDLIDLARAIQETLRSEGSPGNLYQEIWEDTPGQGVTRHLVTASTWVKTLRSRRLRSSLHRGFRYLLPDPEDGSTCKRLHLYFRWMVRPADGIDLGLWPSPSPADLVIPLDTHMTRFCRYLGFLERKSTDLKAALEVTEKLKTFCEEDPLLYDFPLCHLGISGDCIHKPSTEHCPRCPINSHCQLWQPRLGLIG